jgi:hypothetical protein
VDITNGKAEVDETYIYFRQMTWRKITWGISARFSELKRQFKTHLLLDFETTKMAVLVQ